MLIKRCLTQIEVLKQVMDVPKVGFFVQAQLLAFNFEIRNINDPVSHSFAV